VLLKHRSDCRELSADGHISKQVVVRLMERKALLELVRQCCQGARVW